MTVLGSLAATAFWLLPLVSLYHHPETALFVRVAVPALAIAALLRPDIATWLLAASLPLTFALNVRFGLTPPPADVIDALTMAFCAGAVWRLRPRAGEAPLRLARPALLLATIILGSAVVLLAGQGADPSRHIVTELWRHTIDDFLFATRPFLEWHLAVRWITVLGMAVMIERALRRAPQSGPAAVRILLVAGAAWASFDVMRLLQILLERKLNLDPFVAIVAIFRNLRFSAFIPDVNAAGSLFGLFLVAALVLAAMRRSVATLLFICPTLLVACAVSQSRAAVVGAIAVLTVLTLAHLLRRRRFILAAGIIGVVAVVAAVGILSTNPAHARVSESFAVRAEMTQVGGRIVRTHPWFGIGLGGYKTASRTFINGKTPALMVFSPRGENAHNNFLQVLAELGLPALVALLWLVIPSALPWRRLPPDRAWAAPETTAIAAGVAAFLISAVFGHPWLIGTVQIASFLALGVAAGMSPARQPASRVFTWLFALAVVLVVASVPYRAYRAVVPIVEPEMAGLSEVAGEIDGMSYRIADTRSRWLVPPEARRIVLPLRWAADGAEDCTVDVLFDGTPADRVVLEKAAWRPLRFPIPPPDAGVWERPLDLRVSDARCKLLVGELQAVK